MKSNFLKQKSAELPNDIEDKENSNPNTTAAEEEEEEDDREIGEAIVEKKDYHKEGIIDPKTKEEYEELSESQKEELKKKNEEEMINQMVAKHKTIKQNCYLDLESDVFAIY